MWRRSGLKTGVYRCTVLRDFVHKIIVQTGNAVRYSEDGQRMKSLAAETVEGPALSLESVDDVHGSYSFSFGVLGVGDGITDDVLQENLQHTSCFFVDETGDALHATTTCETANGWLRDPLDVVAKNLTVTLRTSFSESLSALSTARHGDHRRNSLSKTAQQISSVQ